MVRTGLEREDLALYSSLSGNYSLNLSGLSGNYTSEMAANKLTLKSMKGTREFLNDVMLEAKTQHLNLSSLLGCCAEGSCLFMITCPITGILISIAIKGNRDKDAHWVRVLLN